MNVICGAQSASQSPLTSLFKAFNLTLMTSKWTTDQESVDCWWKVEDIHVWHRRLSWNLRQNLWSHVWDVGVDTRVTFIYESRLWHVAERSYKPTKLDLKSALWEGKRLREGEWKWQRSSKSCVKAAEQKSNVSTGLDLKGVWTWGARLKWICELIDSLCIRSKYCIF